MRLYLILAALVAACQASHLVNIDGLPDCIQDCMRETSSQFDIEHKKVKHICGVTRSGRYENWMHNHVVPCTDLTCPGDRDSPQWQEIHERREKDSFFVRVADPPSQACADASSKNPAHLKHILPLIFLYTSITPLTWTSPYKDKMQFRNWFFLAAGVMVAASPPEEPIKIDHFPVCEQECMRHENWQLNIDKVTFTTFCVGEHRRMAFLVWVREQLEPCFYYHCGLQRDGQEIKDLWAWYEKTCEAATRGV